MLTDQALQRATQGLIEDHTLGRILTARLDGELVGVAVISFLWTLEHGGPAAWLDEVYVEPGRRGDGIGRKLVEAAMQVARDSGCIALDLEVDAGHEAAERLYRAHGIPASPAGALGADAVMNPGPPRSARRDACAVRPHRAFPRHSSQEPVVMKNPTRAAMIATAAALLFGSIAAAPVSAADEAKVKCEGANACKGKSACATAKNACAGQNSCKGQGYVQLSKAECDAAKADMKKKS